MGLAASSDARIKAIASEPGFKAVLLKTQFSLAINELPKLDEALDALAWKLIGFDDMTQKFDARAIKTALFNRELGNGRATDFKKAATSLLLRRVASGDEGPGELRDAVVRRWIDAQEPTAAEPPRTSWHREPFRSRPSSTWRRSRLACWRLLALAVRAVSATIKSSSPTSGGHFKTIPRFRQSTWPRSRVDSPRPIIPDFSTSAEPTWSRP